MNFRSLSIIVLLTAMPFQPSLVAQDATLETETAERQAASEPVLSDTQQAIKVRFDRFEETLFKMARYLQKTEPARAELVLRALGRSKEERVAERMTLISRMLSRENSGTPQFADAIEEQDAILASIRELLTILRSEDILDDNRLEQERLKELARQVSALIDAEKVHQADTQRGKPTEEVAKGQEKTAQRTDDILKKIDAHDTPKDASDTDGSDSKSSEKSPKDPEDESSEASKPSEKDAATESDDAEAKSPDSEEGQGDTKSGEDKPSKPANSESQGEESETKPQEGSESQDSQPSPGKPQKGSQQSQPSQQGQSGEQGEQSEDDASDQQSPQEPNGSQQATPGREELEEAREKMEQAIKELKEQNREQASKEQEEAIRKLIQAKERIEELLRQLREEERELLLRSLEARFQKMLQLQQAVLNTTERLKGSPHEQWSDREYSLCRDAASTEREILMEAEKSLEVLRSDGSSVAFPEAVEQISKDVSEVAARLGREDAGELTIAIEEEIIEALSEMIQAFQKEMEKLRQEKGQQGGEQGSPSEPGLVDKLAELKMLKTLQLRINRRTKTLGDLIDGEHATEPDVVNQLRELSQRQGRLQRATYDLATGKTVK